MIAISVWADGPHPQGGVHLPAQGYTSLMFKTVPLTTYTEYPPEEMQRRAADFRALMQRRRTVREYSQRPVARALIEECLLTAGTAPSGANLQPWQFVVVTDPAIKRKLRTEAEIEEREFYNGKAPPEWLAALAPLGTDPNKPFLDDAPYLIVIFAKSYDVLPDGRKVKNYYASESVGIATGMLIAALHTAGLATLTHTPSPMGFLNKILNRPENERPFLVLVAGYPKSGVQVPEQALHKKSLAEIAIFV